MEPIRLRDRIIYEVADSVATMTLDWGEKGNLQDHDMVWAFDDALTLAERDYDVKVVVIKANGKGFCAGHVGTGDYPEFNENRARTGTTWTGQQILFVDPVLRLWEFPKPTIAAVHGYAAGCGTYWALLPDITIASEEAWFQMPHVKLMGLPGAETMMEPWLFMSWKRTYEYLYTRQKLTAEEAEHFNLVNRVVPRDELESTAAEMAAVIAEAPLTTLRATKLLVKRAWEMMGLRLHLQWSNDMVSLAAHHTDVQAQIHETTRELIEKGRGTAPKIG